MPIGTFFRLEVDQELVRRELRPCPTAGGPVAALLHQGGGDMLLGEGESPGEEELPAGFLPQPNLVPETQGQFLAQLFTEPLALTSRDPQCARDTAPRPGGARRLLSLPAAPRKVPGRDGGGPPFWRRGYSGLWRRETATGRERSSAHRSGDSTGGHLSSSAASRRRACSIRSAAGGQLSSWSTSGKGLIPVCWRRPAAPGLHLLSP